MARTAALCVCDNAVTQAHSPSIITTSSSKACLSGGGVGGDTLSLTRYTCVTESVRDVDTGVINTPSVLVTWWFARRVQQTRAFTEAPVLTAGACGLTHDVKINQFVY